MVFDDDRDHRVFNCIDIILKSIQHRTLKAIGESKGVVMLEWWGEPPSRYQPGKKGIELTGDEWNDYWCIYESLEFK